jgi:hypothetical protein
MSSNVSLKSCKALRWAYKVKTQKIHYKRIFAVFKYNKQNVVLRVKRGVK